MLKEQIKWGGDRRSNLHDAILKLSDLGIEPTASHRWQRLFDMLEEHLSCTDGDRGAMRAQMAQCLEAIFLDRNAEG